MCSGYLNKLQDSITFRIRVKGFILFIFHCCGYKVFTDSKLILNLIGRYSHHIRVDVFL